MKPGRLYPFALAAALGLASASPTAPVEVTELPEGVWTGHITSRTIPDVEQLGEWAAQIRVEHCGGQAGVAFKVDDEWQEPIALRVVPLVRQYLLILFHQGESASGRWIENQVWTLVDASPGRWTITQSRAVLNPDMAPDAPWRTFRRLAWGSLDFDPDGCKAPPEPETDAEPEPEEAPADAAAPPLRQAAPQAASRRPVRVAQALFGPFAEGGARPRHTHSRTHP